MKFSKIKLLTISTVFASMLLAGCDGSNTTYSISFAMDDGTVLYTGTYKKGEMPEYKEIPTKAEDDTAVYTFAGWDKEICGAKENTTYTAVFSANKKYTITFVDWDGSSIDVQHVVSGATPTLPETPVREDEDELHYDFTGWSPAVSAVGTNDVTYTAQYKSVKTWEVLFKADDGEILATIRVPEGQVPVYPYGIPTIPEDKETKTAYEFVKWDRDFTEIYKDEVYVASFREVESKTDWNSEEKSWLSLCLYELPFYAARFEIKSKAEDGLIYLESGRECTEDDFYNYSILVSEIRNDEMKANLLEMGMDPAFVAKIPDMAFDLVENLATIQDTWVLEDNFGKEYTWNFFRNVGFGLTSNQIIGVGFNEKTGKLIVVETLFYSLTNGQLRYDDSGYISGYPFTYEEENDIYDDFANFAAFALDDVYGSTSEDYNHSLQTAVLQAMPVFEATDTSKDAYIDFAEYSYTNPFSYGNMYSQNYYCPQYEIDFNIIEEEDYNAYFTHLESLGFEYDESMSQADGEYPAKCYKKTIEIVDHDDNGKVLIFYREFLIFVGEYDTQQYIDPKDPQPFEAGYFWVSFMMLEA